jgi:hypothetical protein
MIAAILYVWRCPLPCFKTGGMLSGVAIFGPCYSTRRGLPLLFLLSLLSAWYLCFASFWLCNSCPKPINCQYMPSLSSESVEEMPRGSGWGWHRRGWRRGGWQQGRRRCDHWNEDTRGQRSSRIFIAPIGQWVGQEAHRRHPIDGGIGQHC